MEIVIIDYNMGNVKSVANALHEVGATPVLTNNKNDIEKAKGLLLPGVGAFGDGIQNIRDLGLIDVLNREVLEKGKPILGVCLGMQLLADGSDEHGKHKGLGYVPGWVRKFEEGNRAFKVPHIGWNNVEIVKKEPLFEGIENGSDFYFVHSYYFDTENAEDVCAKASYGFEFTAAVQKDNVFGTQFHPEKSQICGIKLYENFCRYVASC